MASLLKEDGYLINAAPEAAYNFTIQISTGETRFKEIVEWLKQNTITP